ncbi:hypothetical protein ACLI4Z_17195 [Natrialbaceae archaeon A-arb3/5]
MTENVPMNRDRNRETEADATADPDALQAELGEIKSAMGIAERHPYWWRFWVVEGIGVAVGFVLVQLWLRWGFDLRLGAALAGVFALDYLAKRRIKAEYEPPARGLPSQKLWLGIIFVGLGALIVGLGPVFRHLGEAESVRLALLSAAAVVGVGYLYMGQLLEAYDIRAADRYAFYLGGVWILVLAVAIPFVSAFRGWEYAVFGLGLAVHHIGAYIALARH